MSVQRILKGSSATIVEPLLDGLGQVPTPAPTSAQVSIRNAAGEDLGSGITATPTGNTSEFAVDINTAMTVDLDHLTLTWVSAGFQTTTHLEVVGGFLFTIEELRAQSAQLANLTNYTATTLAQVRADVENALEDALGYALVPRFGTTRFGLGSTTLRLHPYLRAVRSITDDATAVDVTTVRYDSTGFVSGYTFTGPTVAAFEHGLDYPSPTARARGLQLAKAWAITGPIDDRTTSFTSPETGITSVYATPGVGGSIFGLPAVDQWVQAERLLAVA